MSFNLKEENNQSKTNLGSEIKPRSESRQRKSRITEEPIPES